MMRLHCAEKVTDEIGERYGSVEYRAGKVLQRWRGSPISSTDEVGERYGSVEYRAGKVLQRWRGSGGNVRPSHLLMR